MRLLKYILKKVVMPLCVFLLPAYAYSQEERPMETESVKVTATRVEKELQDVPSSVSVITSDDIKKSSAKTVGELLQDVPGIQVVNSGAQGLKRISIRGEGVNRTQILIDGQQIVENKSMDGTSLLIDPSTVERIEVIRGPASVLYGSDAIGGVINIITKKGGSKPIQGEASLSYNGSADGFTEYASLYGSAGGFEYRLSGSFDEQRKLRTPEGLAPHTGFGQQDYGAYLAYNVNDDIKVGAAYDYFKSRITAGSMEEGYENFFVDIPEWMRQKARVFGEAKNIASFLPKLRLDAFWQQNHKRMHNHVDVTGMPMVLDNYADNMNEQYGLSVQSDWMIQDHTYVIFGYDFAYDILNADTDQDANSSMPVATFNYLKKSRHEGYEYSNAVYAQGESSLPLDFALSYGVRWTHVVSEMKKAEGTKTVKTTGQISALDSGDVGSTGDSWDNAPVFNAGLMWQGIENLTFRFNFSQGFRTPSLQEKYLVSSMGGGTMIPNPDLKPETSNNFELGARYADYGFIVDAVYFWSIADDYIASQTIDEATSTVRYVNVSSAYTHGAELVLSYEFPFGLKPYTSMTYMERKYDTGSSSTWFTGVPRFQGRAGLAYGHTFNDAFDFHVDAYARFSSDSKEDTSSGLVAYGAWTTANLAMGVNFGEKRQYGLSMEVNNIFNETYQISGDIYEPAVYAAVKFTAGF